MRLRIIADKFAIELDLELALQLALVSRHVAVKFVRRGSPKRT